MQETKKQKMIYTLMHPYRGKVLGLCCLAALTSLVQVSFAVVTSKVVDAALGADGKLLFWSCVLAANLLVMILLHILQNWGTGSITDHSVAKLRGTLLETVTYSEEIHPHAYHSGTMLSRGMEDVRTVCDGVVSAVPAIVGQITRLAASFAAVLVLYRPIAGIIALAALVIAGIVAWLRPILKKEYARMRQSEEQVVSGMQESLQQLELIRSLGAEKQILRRFDIRLKHSLAVKKHRRYWLVGYSSLMTLVTQLGTGVLLLWGAGQVAMGMLSYGALTAMLQLMSLLRGPIVGLSGLWNRLTSAEVAGERLAEMLQSTETLPEPAEVGQVQSVIFEDITFAYPGDETPVVHNFTAEFPLDRWACITGVSGKGKTTLFKLMLGLYTPQQGQVWLQTERGRIPCGKATRHLFAYVPQDYALLSGTIEDNLLLVAPDASEKVRSEALGIAQADFVWGLSAGEQTPVRENNAGLSKGQLQRLAVARAILMDRPILLLDECTSALDAQTEEALLAALYGMGKKAILVTHRPEAVKPFPQVKMVPMEQS